MGIQPPLETLRTSLSTTSLPLDSATSGTTERHVPSNRLKPLEYFDEVFSESPATSLQDVEDAFRLRYQVYCLDRAFEDPGACPAGMEQDHFDNLALHCLLRERARNQVIGTVRLVLPPATPIWFSKLPLTEYAPQESMEAILRLPAGTTAEVSRFAISRSAREILRSPHNVMGQLGDGLQYNGESLLPYMSLGLIRGLVRLSMEHGVTHWCLAAEPALLRRLRSFGLHFQNAGSLVEHRGLRQVCYADLKELLARAEVERPEFWAVITEGGTLTGKELVRQAA